MSSLCLLIQTDLGFKRFCNQATSWWNLENTDTIYNSNRNITSHGFSHGFSIYLEKKFVLASLNTIWQVKKIIYNLLLMPATEWIIYLYSYCRFLGLFTNQVHLFICRFHVFLSNIINPMRASCRKKQCLGIVFWIFAGKKKSVWISQTSLHSISPHPILPGSISILQKTLEAKRSIEDTKMQDTGFPGGAVVKNPPANAGDMGQIPGPGRSHMPRSN